MVQVTFTWPVSVSQVGVPVSVAVQAIAGVASRAVTAAPTNAAPVRVINRRFDGMKRRKWHPQKIGSGKGGGGAKRGCYVTDGAVT